VLLIKTSAFSWNNNYVTNKVYQYFGKPPTFKDLIDEEVRIPVAQHQHNILLIRERTVDVLVSCELQ
jgi:hypothetical protein